MSAWRRDTVASLSLRSAAVLWLIRVQPVGQVDDHRLAVLPVGDVPPGRLETLANLVQPGRESRGGGDGLGAPGSGTRTAMPAGSVSRRMRGSAAHRRPARARPSTRSRRRPVTPRDNSPDWRTLNPSSTGKTILSARRNFNYARLVPLRTRPETVANCKIADRILGNRIAGRGLARSGPRAGLMGPISVTRTIRPTPRADL